MIEVVYDEDAGRIRIRGHAGAGEYGNDIVCAAASILVLTAERALGRGVKAAGGEAEIRTDDKIVLRVIMAGYEWLGENCPEYVKVTRRKVWTKN